MIELLHSMGVTKFDASIPAALNEYAKRYAAEILSDGKDFSVYAGKKEIDADDIKLALKLSDSRISGIDANIHAVEELKDVINKHSLESLLENPPISVRSLPLTGEQRSFTMITGSEAYKQYLNTQAPSTAMDQSA